MNGYMLVASGFLFGAFASDLPGAYFQLLRMVVSGVSIYGWFRAEGKNPWNTFFAVSAILFNPIIPIHLTRDIWVPIDMLTGSFFLVAAIVFRKPQSAKEPA